MNDLPPMEEPTRVGEEMEAELKKESECVSGSQNNSGGVLVRCVYFYGKIVYKSNFAKSRLSLLWNFQGGAGGGDSTPELGCLLNTAHVWFKESCLCKDSFSYLQWIVEQMPFVKFWAMKTVPISQQYLVTNGRSSHRKSPEILTVLNIILSYFNK